MWLECCSEYSVKKFLEFSKKLWCVFLQKGYSRRFGKHTEQTETNWPKNISNELGKAKYHVSTKTKTSGKYLYIQGGEQPSYKRLNASNLVISKATVHIPHILKLVL